MGRTVKRSKTSSFGTVTREGHDSRAFYGKRLYQDLRNGSKESGEYREHTPEQVDVIHCADARDMHHLPDNSVHLMITSPPYNVGKDYDDDLSLSRVPGPAFGGASGDVPDAGAGGPGVCKHSERRADALHTLARRYHGHRP